MDPFGLEVVESPPGSGEYLVQDPAGKRSANVEIAGLCLVGAGQALLALSFRWMRLGAREADPPAEPPGFGEVRLRVRRKEARLLASLLRSHLRRLEAPASWQRELLDSLEQIDEFLRWE